MAKTLGETSPGCSAFIHSFTFENSCSVSVAPWNITLAETLRDLQELWDEVVASRRIKECHPREAFIKNSLCNQALQLFKRSHTNHFGSFWKNQRIIPKPHCLHFNSLTGTQLAKTFHKALSKNNWQEFAGIAALARSSTRMVVMNRMHKRKCMDTYRFRVHHPIPDIQNPYPIHRHRFAWQTHSGSRVRRWSCPTKYCQFWAYSDRISSLNVSHLATSRRLATCPFGSCGAFFDCTEALGIAKANWSADGTKFISSREAFLRKARKEKRVTWEA